jgi:hypothetical protein
MAYEPTALVHCTAQVRYRDGRLVSTRGEKYILESVSEEYDGGSRGKVKTKGAGGLHCSLIGPCSGSWCGVQQGICFCHHGVGDICKWMLEAPRHLLHRQAEADSGCTCRQARCGVCVACRGDQDLGTVLVAHCYQLYTAHLAN